MLKVSLDQLISEDHSRQQGYWDLKRHETPWSAFSHHTEISAAAHPPKSFMTTGTAVERHDIPNPGTNRAHKQADVQNKHRQIRRRLHTWEMSITESQLRGRAEVKSLKPSSVDMIPFWSTRRIIVPSTKKITPYLSTVMPGWETRVEGNESRISQNLSRICTNRI